MHVSLDSALGRQRRLNSVGESVLQIAPSAAAAYSLRSLTGGDPKVVRVRRGSDNHEQDFTASEVSSGALTSFVNAQVVAPLDIQALSATGRDGDFLIAKAAYSLRSLGTRQASIANIKPTSFIVAGAGTSAANGTYVQNGLSPSGGLPKPIAYTLFDTDGTTALFSLIGEVGGDGTLIAGSPDSGNPILYEGALDGAQSDEYQELSSVAGGSAPAPSLTSGQFDKYVIEVRRSSDNSTKQFTATEITDGTLLAFTNADYAKYTSDFSSGDDSWGSFDDVTETGNIDGIGGLDNNLRLAIGSATSDHRAFRGSILPENQKINFSAKVFIPSTNSVVDSIGIRDANGSVIIAAGTTPTQDEWVTVTANDVTVTNAQLRVDIQDGGTNNFAGNGSDVIYLREITVTQVTSDGFARTWYDQSVTTQAGDTATGNHATQGDYTKQPKIVNAGNLFDELNFDGTDDNFELTSVLGITSVGAIFSVAESGGGTDNIIIDNRDASGDGLRLFRGGSQLKLNWKAVTRANGSLSSDTKFIGFGGHSGSSVTVGVNGGDAATSDSNTISVTSKAHIGARSFSSATGFWDGTMNEIIIYDSDQTDNRTAIEANIGEAYNINLPSGVDPLNDEVDGFVETWYDQSGNSKNAVQATAAEQPKIVNAGNFLDELDFDFDGTGHSLDIDFGADLSQANSFFMVHQSDGIVATKNEFFDSSGGASPRTLLDQSGSNYRMLGASSVNTGVAVTTAKSLVFALYNGASSLFAKNGTATSVLNAGTADINQNSTLGSSGSRFYDGSIQEVIIYNSDQTNNRVAVETNIISHYGIS
jgi:hypothetical protein